MVFPERRKPLCKNDKQYKKGIDDKNNSFFKDPFGLYIHIPFCIAKCNYCDFYSESLTDSACSSNIFDKRQVNDINIEKNNENHGTKILDQFLTSLKKEIRLYAEKIDCREIRTIYFGGGTPSLISPDQIKDILNELSNLFNLAKDIEITMEANPSSLTKNKIVSYKDSGINRLSVGVQSFINEELEFLGRLHTADQAIEIVKNIKEVFQNFNIDLIFALPEQSVGDWEYTLKKVLSLEPLHLSLYNLQIEEGTPMAQLLNEGVISTLDDKLDAEMYQKARLMLEKVGYEQYEISNFSFPGFQSRHNKIYWNFEPYLGLGPAAHSFTGSKRFYNYSNLAQYINMIDKECLPLAEKISLDIKEQMAEMVFMGLRLLKGIDKEDFYKRFNIKIEEVYEEELEELIAMNLLKMDQNRVSLTEKGLFLGNEVFMRFLPD